MREKCRKFVGGHFAGRHGKLAMFDGALAADMAVDPDVVRRVGKNHGGTIACEHVVERRSLERGATIQAVVVEEPKIAGPGYGGDADHGWQRIGLIIGLRAAAG